MTPAQQRARIGGLHAQAKHGNRLAANARRGLQAKFEREADPDGVLSEDERLRRADMLRKAHYARMTLAASRARQAKKKAATPAKET